MLVHAKRMRWSRERIYVERQRSLRELLQYATNRSPFFAERLSGIESEEFVVGKAPSIVPLSSPASGLSTAATSLQPAS